jgi:hypothetical protein
MIAISNMQIPYIGKEFSNIMSKYKNTVWFGALYEDRS